jgi:FlaA1/EpsC-like NDP-sugar epimerase
MDNFYRDKVILITGAAGTIGKELVRQLTDQRPAEIRLVDNCENDLFLLGEHYRYLGRVTPYLGDIRDEHKIFKTVSGVDTIFHAAAVKHVELSEYNPFEAVQTNILGLNNVLQAAMYHEVPHLIFTSSNDAVNPSNVMGTSKLMGERLVTAANIVNANRHQVFTSVRFGNVIGSQGSVVPIFASQICRGGPVTVTDPQMTRFVMTIEQAVKLLLEIATMACGGEVLIPKMPVMCIKNLAEAMIELVAPGVGYDPSEIRLEFIGAKPGEKLYEELISAGEVSRTIELRSMYVVLPALRSIYRNIRYYYDGVVTGGYRPYNSALEVPMTTEEIKDYLNQLKVLEKLFNPSGYQKEIIHIPDLSFSREGQGWGKNT